MRIAIDLDGVCYEWQRTYRYMLRVYHQVFMPPVEAFWYYWNAPDQFTTKQQRDWMWKEGVELGLFRYGHMVAGTRIGLQALAEAGHDLVVVTHRPKNAINDTLDWVRYYFNDIPLSEVRILSNQEPKTCVDADVLIDDKPENVIEWCATGRKAILFSQPWNRDMEVPVGCRVADGWEEVVTAIKEVELATV